MIRRPLLLAAALFAGGMALAQTAHADPPCGRGWRRGEYCGPRHRDRDWDRRDRYERRGDWQRRDDWRRRDAGRRERAYPLPPPIAHVQPAPLLQLNIR